jgi:hypothetical protein
MQHSLGWSAGEVFQTTILDSAQTAESELAITDLTFVAA